MNYLTRDIPIYQHCRQVLSTLVVAGVLAGCAITNEGTGGASDADTGGINTTNCTVTDISRPVANETDVREKSRPVCIVFIDDCPQFTVFAGQKDGVPELSEGKKENDVKKLVWQAVTVNSKDGEDVEYTNADYSYSIIFDPFKKSRIKSKGKGVADSEKLCGNHESACGLPYADFKYTICTTDNPACKRLDPVIRVNR